MADKTIKVIRHPVDGGMIHDRTGKEWQCSYVKCELEYCSGGYMFGTGTTKPRGYYISVQPVVDRGDGMVQFAAFSGFYDLLIGCGRPGKKIEKEAERMFMEKYKDEVNEYYPDNKVDFSKNIDAGT